jgi:hypothetical protein
MYQSRSGSRPSRFGVRLQFVKSRVEGTRRIARRRGCKRFRRSAFSAIVPPGDYLETLSKSFLLDFTDFGAN